MLPWEAFPFNGAKFEIAWSENRFLSFGTNFNINDEADSTLHTSFSVYRGPLFVRFASATFLARGRHEWTQKKGESE